MIKKMKQRENEMRTPQSKPTLPLHLKIWFYSYIALLCVGLIFPFEWLYPILVDNDRWLNFVKQYIPAAFNIAAKSEFPEYFSVYIIWNAVIGLIFQLWALLVPYIAPKDITYKSKKDIFFCYLGFPIYIYSVNWVCLFGGGGSSYWGFLYEGKGIFAVVFPLFWVTAITSTWAIKYLTLCLYKKTIIIK